MTTPTLQTTILRNLLNNEQFTRKVVPFLKKEYFEGIHRNVFDQIVAFVGKYNNLPTAEALSIEMQETNITDEQFGDASVILNEISKPDDANIDWLMENTEKWCQDRAIFIAIMEGISIIDGKHQELTKNALPDLLSDALSVTFDTNVGHDYIENAEGRYEFYHQSEERLPFDLDLFNEITKGGLPNKTLNIALAGTGVGKSLFMCHMAGAAMSQGKNALYITMEMAEERIAERIDANLFNTPVDQLKDLNHELFIKKVDKIAAKTNGKLVIKEYPTGSAHVGHFRALLNELKLKKKFIPDIIFIDYLNICASSRVKGAAAANSYTLVKSIAEELRGLAVEFNVPLVSATQTTRSGYCLDPYTQVISKEGKKLLKDVKLGDELLSNEGYNTVKTVFPIQTKKTYEVRTKSGKTIYCSADHLFPTESGQEKSISYGLKVGDKLITK